MGRRENLKIKEIVRCFLNCILHLVIYRYDCFERLQGKSHFSATPRVNHEFGLFFYRIEQQQQH
jgi:hypothetical protein